MCMSYMFVSMSDEGGEWDKNKSREERKQSNKMGIIESFSIFSTQIFALVAFVLKGTYNQVYDH